MKTKTGSPRFVKTIALLLTCFTAFVNFAQDRLSDSLISVIGSSAHDSVKVKALINLAGKMIPEARYDSALSLADKAMQLSARHRFRRAMGEIHSIRGIVHNIRGSYPAALTNFLLALDEFEKLDRHKNVARCLMYIGIVHMYQHDYEKALVFIDSSYRINKRFGYHTEIPANLMNRGLVYRNQKKYELSISSYREAYQLNEQLQNDRPNTNILLSLGLNYDNLADDTTREPDNKKRKELQATALDYYSRALERQKRSGDRYGQAINMSSIGLLLGKMGNMRAGMSFLDSADATAKELGLVQEQAGIAMHRVILFQIAKNYKKAFEHYQKYVALTDSMYSSEKREAMAEKQIEFTYAKREARMQALAEAEKYRIAFLAAEEKKQQQLILTGVGLCLLLTAIFAVFIYNRFRVTRQQKSVIELQKHEMEIRNREIRESIDYARHLQNAILPPEKFLKKFLPESFVLYLPKDIVAGDFYWMESVSQRKSPGQNDEAEHIFVAAADSTGHGVPGAIVSVICGNALNRAVTEFGLRDTGLILDKTTEIVLTTFEKSDKQIADGMDISLLAIDTLNRTVSWAGANNNLWYISADTGRLLEVQADKQPIGHSERRKPFTTHLIPFAQNGTFYLFTDGYADQFGGPRGKKFMYRQLKDTIAGIASFEMERQKQVLLEKFNSWKTGLEQVDDVCIIGIKLT